MAVGPDIFGAVLPIVTSTRALKAFGEKESRVAENRYVKEASRGRHDGAIVTDLDDKGLVAIDCIFI